MNYSNILVPVDFSEINKLAIQKAAEIQLATGAELTLAHIIDYMPPVYVRPEMPEIFASDKLMSERAQKHLDTLIGVLGIEVCHSLAQTGKTNARILRLIKDKNIDLVVMGKHSQSGLDKLVGSTTNNIVQRAKCDVLVVHEQN